MYRLDSIKEIFGGYVVSEIAELIWAFALDNIESLSFERCRAIARRHRMTQIRGLSERGRSIDDVIGAHGRLEDVKWLLDSSGWIDSTVAVHAVERGALDILRFCLNQDVYPGYVSVMLGRADIISKVIQWGHAIKPTLDILRSLIAIDTIECSKMHLMICIIRKGICCGSDDVLAMIEEKFKRDHGIMRQKFMLFIIDRVKEETTSAGKRWLNRQLARLDCAQTDVQ